MIGFIELFHRYNIIDKALAITSDNAVINLELVSKPESYFLSNNLVRPSVPLPPPPVLPLMNFLTVLSSAWLLACTMPVAIVGSFVSRWTSRRRFLVCTAVLEVEASGNFVSLRDSGFSRSFFTRALKADFEILGMMIRILENKSSQFYGGRSRGQTFHIFTEIFQTLLLPNTKGTRG